MDILRSLLIVVEALCSLLLIGIILIQKSKGEGLGLAFGAGVGETLFGSRAGNVLTRITIGLGAVFMVNTVVLAILFSGGQASLVEKSVGAAGGAMPLEQATEAVPEGAVPGSMPAVEPDAAAPVPEAPGATAPAPDAPPPAAGAPAVPPAAPVAVP